MCQGAAHSHQSYPSSPPVGLTSPPPTGRGYEGGYSVSPLSPGDGDYMQSMNGERGGSQGDWNTQTLCMGSVLVLCYKCT